MSGAVAFEGSDLGAWGRVSEFGGDNSRVDGSLAVPINLVTICQYYVYEFWCIHTRNYLNEYS